MKTRDGAVLEPEGLGALPGAFGLVARLRAMVEVFKPITWFPPMWAFGCGVASAGQPLAEHWLLVIGGVLLAGPFVCGTSQVVNDWFDRHVDAINEPNRPIPSGRLPGRLGLHLAILATLLSMILAYALGPWPFGAGLIGLALAWAYSAPPLRLKLNGWYGNAAVGLCYEGLPWITGAAVAGASLPDVGILSLATLYSLGAFGIMILNDFKSIEGDRHFGVASLPVQLGPEGAARLACVVMALPQVVVVGLLAAWGHPIAVALITLGLLVQIGCMRHWLRAPKERAPWYNGTGVGLYVLGMLTAALALGAAS